MNKREVMKVENLVRNYKMVYSNRQDEEEIKVLKGLDFTIEEQEFVGIMGKSGCGKTTLLKEVALSVLKNNPEVHLLILLIDERPEEVTDIKETIQGDNVEIIYSLCFRIFIC